MITKIGLINTFTFTSDSWLYLCACVAEWLKIHAQQISSADIELLWLRIGGLQNLSSMAKFVPTDLHLLISHSL